MAVAGIADVAKRAGVSKMSVSRVLNNSPLVADDTRARVLQAMVELNYTPNAAARSLARGRSKLIGVLLPPSSNPIFARYADGIQKTAFAAGYSVFVCKPDMGSGGEREILQLLHEQRVAGIIMQHVEWPYQRHLPALVDAGVHVVTLDQRVPGCDRVTIDNAAAMERAVTHLVDLGHVHIGMITGPLHLSSERERLVGYRRALRRRGLPLRRRSQVVAENFTDASAINAANALLRRGDRPSALIVSSSDLVPNILIAIGAAHLRVPEDLALVCVGDLSWTPSLVSPITSLVEPAEQMGADACRLLLDRLKQPSPKDPTILRHTAQLAIRLSCGAPPAMRDVPLHAPESLLFYDAALAWSEDTVRTEARSG
jgi:LacI family transcriptional regulator